MAIRETEKGYYVEVYLGKDPLTGKKIRKTKLFSPVNKKSLKDAKAFEAEWLLKGINGEIDINSNMILKDYINYWYNTYVKVNCAIQTQIRYKTFSDCINSNIGHIKLEKLTPPLIQQFYSKLILENKKLKNGTMKRRYSNGTVLKTHKMLHLALKWAVSWQMLAYNPTDSVMPPSDDTRNINTWSIDDINKFLSLIHDENVYAAVNIAYRTGMRAGEISALKWNDIDFKNQVIKVRHNMAYANGELILQEPKTKNSKRDIDIDDDTKNWLKSVQLHQQEQNLALPQDLKINYEYVCSWIDGKPFIPSYITKSFTRLVKKHSSQFNKITFHGLRHSHASILFQEGISSNVISKRLGHSRTSITDDIYIHIKPQMQKEAAKIFGAAIKKVK
jgi:integrase